MRSQFLRSIKTEALRFSQVEPSPPVTQRKALSCLSMTGPFSCSREDHVPACALTTSRPAFEKKIARCYVGRGALALLVDDPQLVQKTFN